MDVAQPFDVEATVAFSHVGSDARHATQMFCADGDTWSFRFTATRSGTWRFATARPYEELDGWSGIVEVQPNPDPDAAGFLTTAGSRMAVWQDHDSEVPSLESFAVLKTLILRAAERGRSVQVWAWGDEERGWTRLPMARESQADVGDPLLEFDLGANPLDVVSSDERPEEGFFTSARTLLERAAGPVLYERRFLHTLRGLGPDHHASGPVAVHAGGRHRRRVGRRVERRRTCAGARSLPEPARPTCASTVGPTRVAATPGAFVHACYAPAPEVKPHGCGPEG